MFLKHVFTPRGHNCDMFYGAIDGDITVRCVAMAWCVASEENIIVTHVCY